MSLGVPCGFGDAEQRSFLGRFQHSLGCVGDGSLDLVGELISVVSLRCLLRRVCLEVIIGPGPANGPCGAFDSATRKIVEMGKARSTCPLGE